MEQISLKSKIIKVFFKYVLLSSFSGYLYVTMEMLYRGRSDVSMMYLASIIGLIMALVNDTVIGYEMDFSIQVLICTIAATIGEYVFGIIFNADYSIWDYRHLPFNIQGQICLPFTVIWLALSMVCIPLLDYIEWAVIDDKKSKVPHYKVFGKLVWTMR